MFLICSLKLLSRNWHENKPIMIGAKRHAHIRNSVKLSTYCQLPAQARSLYRQPLIRHHRLHLVKRGLFDLAHPRRADAQCLANFVKVQFLDKIELQNNRLAL